MFLALFLHFPYPDYSHVKKRNGLPEKSGKMNFNNSKKILPMNKTIISLLIIVMFTVTAYAQQTLKGNVKSSSDNQPLPGVSILIKGTQMGTVTDLDGKFSIEVKPKDVIIFSFTGFKTKEVKITDQNSLDIMMDEDARLLNEVVVVGYGSQRKSDITGSVSSIKPKEIQSLSVTRTDEALQGQIAGVQVIDNDASPNANISIRVRGINSIMAASDPLVIIDGMQGGRLSDVHPNDIESIEVLKDASATAIYGSRGAGGVILISTKKGDSKKPTITYNIFGSLQTVRKKLDFMNAAEYSNYVNENRRARGLADIFTGNIEGVPFGDYFKTHSTDWQDEIFRTGNTQNHHLSISGKSTNISYNIAGDYLSTKGIVINSMFKKFSLRSNLAIDITPKVKFTLNTFLSSSEDHPITLDSRDQFGSPIFAALNFAPTRPVYESDGTYSKPGGGYGPNTEYNPVALAMEPVNIDRLNTRNINPELEIKLFKSLKFQSSASYQLSDDEYDYYYNEKIIENSGNTPLGDRSVRTASISNSRWMQFQNTNILTYENLFNEIHRLTATMVLEQQFQKSTSNYAAAKGFLTNEKQYKNLGLGDEYLQPSSYESYQSLLSYMGRINYTLLDRYSIALTLRRDGASVFAQNNKWGNFPSAGIAWNISNEKFMQNLHFITNLKLRASYGVVGNQAITPYQSLDLLLTNSKQSYSFNGGGVLNQGVQLSTLAGNPNLKWESTKQWNGGIDLSLFEKGRLNLTFDLYRKITDDLLFPKNVKLASGRATQLINAGSIRNQGIDIVLNGIPVNQKNFEWNSTITFSLNRTKVLALNDDVQSLILGGAGLPGFSDAVRLEVGKPIGLVKGFKYEGVWKSNERILAAAYGVTPGSQKYLDKDNNGVIDGNDMVDIAHTLPDFTYSWSNTLRVMNLSLNVLIVGVQGNDIVNMSRFITESGADGVSRALLNRWTPQNENSLIPGDNSLGDQRNSSRWVENGSFIRVKNITLGYSFPSKWLKAIKLQNLRLYVSGANLFTLTKYSGYDPEANNASNIATGGNTGPFTGFDMGSYPSQRKYTIGLDVTF